MKNNRLSGTSKFVRSMLVATAILGGALVSGTAMSQGGGGKVIVSDIHFNIVELKPANPELGFKAETIEVALLLPAVQKVREAAARIKLTGEGWDLVIPVFGHADRTRVGKVMLWVTEAAGVPSGENLILNIKDQSGQTHQLRIPGNDIAISVLPAVQLGGDVLSASAKHTTVNEITMGDGSVRPILIGMLLPAVQKIRG